MRSRPAFGLVLLLIAGCCTAQVVPPASPPVEVVASPRGPQVRNGEAVLRVTNNSASGLSFLWSEVTGRTLVAASELYEGNLALALPPGSSKEQAKKALEEMCRQRGIQLVAHGEKWTLAFPKEKAERVLKELPPPPAESGKEVRAGMMRFKATPMTTVVDIYAELRKAPRANPEVRMPTGSPPDCTMNLHNEMSWSEARYTLELLFFVNGYKVVEGGPNQFELVKW